MGNRDTSGAGRRSFTRLHLAIEDALVERLERYLQTAWQASAEGQGVGFVARRGADVDALLCRLVMDGEDTSEPLMGKLGWLLGGAEVAASELSASWCLQTAAELHRLAGLDDRLDSLEDRLIAYARAYCQEERQVFGFGDFEDTEPPDAWIKLGNQQAPAAGVIESNQEAFRDDASTETKLPEAGMRWAALATNDPDTLSALAGPVTVEGRQRFFTELEREVNRGHRGLGSVSVVLIEIAATGEIDRQQATAVVRERLRPYDACCLLAPGCLGLILPGTTYRSCAAVVARLRRSLDQSIDADVAIGVASWPEDGVTAVALLEGAEGAIARDRRRCKSGEVEFASVPPFMAEDGATEDRTTSQMATLWLEGLPAALRVQAIDTDSGVRLRAPLEFLQSGAWVRLRTSGGSMVSGQLEAASLGRRSDGPPVLELEVLPPAR